MATGIHAAAQTRPDAIVVITDGDRKNVPSVDGAITSKGSTAPDAGGPPGPKPHPQQPAP